MDKLTKSYRIRELSKVYPHSTYNAKIVISSGNGEGKTKHLDITNEELYQIKSILTK